MKTIEEVRAWMDHEREVEGCTVAEWRAWERMAEFIESEDRSPRSESQSAEKSKLSPGDDDGATEDMG